MPLARKQSAPIAIKIIVLYHASGKDRAGDEASQSKTVAALRRDCATKYSGVSFDAPLVGEGGDACYGSSQDQRMHIMRTLVGVHHFQVHQMAGYAKLVADAIATHHVAG